MYWYILWILHKQINTKYNFPLIIQINHTFLDVRQKILTFTNKSTYITYIKKPKHLQINLCVQDTLYDVFFLAQRNKQKENSISNIM